MDEAAVRSALKEIHPDLLLIPPGATFSSRPEQERRGYRVYQRVSADMEPVFILAWIDEGTREPLPLSSGIVEAARRADKNTRGRQLDEAARNAIRDTELEKQKQRMAEGIADNWVPKHGRPVTPKSRALQLARMRGRQNGKQTFS